MIAQDQHISKAEVEDLGAQVQELQQFVEQAAREGTAAHEVEGGLFRRLMSLGHRLFASNSRHYCIVWQADGEHKVESDVGLQSMRRWLRLRGTAKAQDRHVTRGGHPIEAERRLSAEHDRGWIA